MDKKSNEIYNNNGFSSSYYNVFPEEKVENLKDNLRGDSYEEQLIKEFIMENNNISTIFGKQDINETDMKIENSSNFDDKIFEEKVVQIFTKSYELDALNIYPYLEIVNSKEKHKKITQISYYKITCKKNNLISYYYFLYNRKVYLIKFSDLIILFTKSKGILKLSVLKNNYNSPRDYVLKKEGQSFNLCFQYREIIPELVNYIREIENLKCEIYNSKNIKEKESESILNEKKIEILENIIKTYEKKYEEKEIEKEKDMKQIELEIIENKIKYNNLIKVNDKDLKNQYITVKKEIKELDNLLTNITIKVEIIEKELDGFFISTKEILLTNSIGDKINIPKGKPIILEVKNNSNYKNIIDNIRRKKKFIKLLGLNDDLFFFVGILRDIKINEDQKNIINQDIKNFNFKNTIIIYPENSKLLGIPLIEEKPEEEDDILSAIFKKLNILDEIKKELAEIKSKIK